MGESLENSSEKKTEKECDWGLMRVLSLHPRPKCLPVKWKVKIDVDSPICAGRVMYLCDYHKKNLLVKFVEVEKLSCRSPRNTRAKKGEREC